MNGTKTVLRVDGLEIGERSNAANEATPIVTGVSFEVREREVVAIVGESGSGKSTICQAVIGLLSENLSVRRGSITFEGDDITHMSSRKRRALQGRRIGMVFQDPLASLNPIRKIKYQLIEARIVHRLQKRKGARGWALRTLAELGFKDPARTMDAYPHTLSGGMRQRVCVGIAFSGEPSMVIADEPTTALDVSLQGRLLRLLLTYAERLNSALILVSHDLSVVKAVADRIVVMYGGRVLEIGPAQQVLADPRSPYTRALLDSLPTLDPELRGQELATIAGEAGGRGSTGCPFQGRCPRAVDACSETFPEVSGDEEHQVWCWNPVRLGVGVDQ